MGEDQRNGRGLMWLDYVIFFATVVTSLGIGLCQARGKQRTTSEFLMGDRKLRVFPVAVSLLVSYLSVITLLGNASELHYFGTSYIFFTIGRTFSYIVTGCVVVPLMYPLRLTSINDVSSFPFPFWCSLPTEPFDIESSKNDVTRVHLS